jgi:hypothetical protein
VGYTYERDGRGGKEGQEEQDGLAPQTKFLDPPLLILNWKNAI